MLARKVFETLTDIARTKRAEFVAQAGEEIGEINAARLHIEVDAIGKLIDNLEVALKTRGGVGAQPSAGFQLDAALTDTGKSGEPGGYAQQIKCSCKDCEAAVSPLAYLADLLDYAIEHVENDGKAITLKWLENNFHQPFGDLPANCEAMDQQVRQVRLCIEVLLKLLKAQKEEGAQTSLFELTKLYREAAYRKLLEKNGTYFEELRKVVSYGSAEPRNNLANRLAFLRSI